MTTDDTGCDAALLLITAGAERRLLPVERGRLDTHLGGCDRCAELAAAEDHDIALMQTLAPAPGPGAAVEPRVLQVVDPELYAWQGSVARGGMGVVVRAIDLRLDRPVAIKELLDDSLRSRFEREARLTARLQHPSIVSIYEAGRWPSGEPFYAMKLVEGRSLADAIAGCANLPARLELLPNLIAVADAIAYAHTQRVVHRDLKPDNVLVGAFGETVVVDWGLAKDLADVGAATEEPAGVYRSAGELTQAGAGTPHYMPPEQARGALPNERFDVYALGATLYHLLTGQPPYGRRPALEVVEQLLTRPPEPLADTAPGAPRDLVAIAAKAMAREPADRYASAVELAAELRRYQAGQLVEAHAYSTGELARRFVRRHRAAVSIAAAALALCTAGAAVGVNRVVRERDRADAARGDAEVTATALYEEQGRRELLDGRPQRALPYLAAAYGRGRAGDGLRVMLGEAMPAVDAPVVLPRASDGNPILRAGFSPDGAYLVTASAGGLAVRDPANGTVLRELPGSLSFAFSPDGTRLAAQAAFSSGHLVNIWDLRDGRRVGSVGAHDYVSDLAFSPDGALLVTADLDDTVRVWDLVHDQPRWSFREGPVLHVTFVGDSGRIAAHGPKPPVYVWDTGDGRLLGQFGNAAGDDRFALGATLSADGRQAAVTDYTGTTIFDLVGLHARATIAVLARPAVFSPGATVLGVGDAAGGWQLFETGSFARIAIVTGAGAVVSRLAFSPDGRRVAAVQDDGVIVIRESAGGRELERLTGHRAEVIAATFSPDGARLLSVDAEGTARLWGAGSAGTPEVRLAMEPSSLAFAPDADRVVVGQLDAPARLWDPAARQQLAVFSDERGLDGTAAVAVSPDGRLLATADGRGEVRIWNARTGSPVTALSGHADRVTAIAFSGDGALVATGCDDEMVRVWTTADGTLLRSWRRGEPITRVAFAAGERIAAAGRGGSAWLFDPRANGPVATLTHLGEVRSLAFSADGTQLLSASADGRARLFDAATGERRALFAGHRGAVLVARFSPDGRRVATAGEDGTVRLWDPAGGAATVVLAESIGGPNALAFDPTGALLATGGAEGTVRVWETASGLLVRAMPGHELAVGWLAFGAGGDRLLSVSENGDLRSWPLPREQRPPAEVAALVDAAVPWRLERGLLVPREAR